MVPFKVPKTHRFTIENYDDTSCAGLKIAHKYSTALAFIRLTPHKPIHSCLEVFNFIC